MRSLRRIRLIAVRVALLGLGSTLGGAASAQSGEAHGFVEPCTIGNHQEMHTECELCTLPANDTEVCTRRLGKLGYEKKCQTNPHSGAAAEVWCIAKGAAAEKTQVAEKNEAGEPGSKLVLALVVSAALLGLFFVVKRRRAKRDPAS